MGKEGAKRLFFATATAVALSGMETTAPLDQGCVVGQDMTTTRIPSNCFQSIAELGLGGEIYRGELLENILGQIVPADRMDSASVSVQNATGNFLLIDQALGQMANVSVGIYDRERSGYMLSSVSPQDLTDSRDSRLISIDGLVWGASTSTFALSHRYTNSQGEIRSGASIFEVSGPNVFITILDVAEGNIVTGITCIPEVRDGEGFDVFYISFETPNGDTLTSAFEHRQTPRDENVPEGARA